MFHPSKKTDLIYKNCAFQDFLIRCSESCLESIRKALNERNKSHTTTETHLKRISLSQIHMSI